MPSIRSLLPRLKFGSDIGANKLTLIQQPLLSTKEILDIYHRVEMMQLKPQYLRETAHRQLGEARSAYRGQGLDYDESRPYQTGDESRLMNWRLNARTGGMYMKVLQEERRPATFIVLDRRATMRFGSRVRLKVTQGCRLAAFAAFLAHKQNSPVSGVLLDSTPKWLMEARNEQSIFELIDQFALPCPPATHLNDETLFNNIVTTMIAMLTPGCNIYLISDFHDTNQLSQPGLMQLSAIHQVCALHILDPVEQALPQMGKVKFIDHTTKQITTINTSDNNSMAAYKELTKSHFDRIHDLFDSLNISYKILPTTKDTLEDEFYKDRP